MVCDVIWSYLMVYTTWLHKRGMISWNPLGRDICPYGGRDDELLTTEHPREPNQPRGLGHWRCYVCRKHWHCVSWRIRLYMWGAMHIRMQMRSRVPEVDTAVYLASPSVLEVETRPVSMHSWEVLEVKLVPDLVLNRDLYRFSWNCDLTLDLNIIWSEKSK